GTRPRTALHRRGQHQGQEGGARRRGQQARGRAGRGRRAVVARRCVEGGPVSRDPEPSAADRRCGFIAVIGAPNAGKSTLVNTLVGTKVSIVSHKAQTTRTALRGIAIAGASQLVFIDTPGMFQPRRRLDRAMLEAAWGGVGDADLVLLLIDASKGLDGESQPILAKLETVAAPLILVLTKIDRVAKQRLLTLAADLNGRLQFAATFMVSALDGSGVEDLKGYVARQVPAGPWHFPPDEVSDAPMRLLAAEITREKVDQRLHDELPYQMRGGTEGVEGEEGGGRGGQAIFVEGDRQRKNGLGKGGQNNKRLSIEARQELGEILGTAVPLFPPVKVGEWENDPERYQELGLTFP